MIIHSHTKNQVNISNYSEIKWGCRGSDHMVVGFTITYVQSVPITT